MDTKDLEHSIGQLGEAIRDLSKQVQALQQISREDSEKLKKYKEEGISLDFTLVTGGLITGKILCLDGQSFGIRTDSGQTVILYKHAIAFIQERVGTSRQ